MSASNLARKLRKTAHFFKPVAWSLPATCRKRTTAINRLVRPKLWDWCSIRMPTPRQGLDFLGGERRSIRWRHGPEKLPECPTAVRTAIVQSRSCRLILATPACFAHGYLPGAARLVRSGVTATVQAVANNRYQVVSGWDYALGKPKPSRRLAPAGTVYFLKLAGSDDAIGQFVDDVWLQSISDDEQDQRDGFGLALLGTWDGMPKPLVLRPEETCMRIPEPYPPDVEWQHDEKLSVQTRRYRIITPLYGGGVTPNEADPITVVRATEVRGHLRYWWRATRGGQFHGSVAAMKEAEEQLWGSAAAQGKAGPSRVSVVVSDALPGSNSTEGGN